MKVDKKDSEGQLAEGETITIPKILELAKIPPSVGSPPNYKHIIKMDLPNCGLTELPTEFPNTFPQLSILFLSNNKFKQMPKSIGDCPKLKMVAFRSNGMASIHPEALQPQLQWCILTDNELTTLPDTIGKCTNLEKLMLTGNKITHLPDTIAQCTKLVMIRLASNALTEMPLSLLKIPSMKWIAFSDNPVTKDIPGLPSPPELPVLKEIQDGDGEILGEGGGGVTRKVKYKDQWVAVKTYHGAMTTDGLPEEERRMACVAGGLGSPCLIQVLGKTAGGALTMEFLDQYQMFGGRPNFDTCWKDVYDNNRQLTSEEADTVVTGLLGALSQLHSVGLCHGDFYGHNILIQETNLSNVRLGDFGGAFFYDRSAPYAGLIEQCELRSFAVFVDEVAVCLQGGSNPDTMTQWLKDLGSKSLEPKMTFQQTLTWWNERNQRKRKAGD